MKLCDEPSVAIILVNWNGLEYTLACIHSLRSVTYKNLDIIVVDNGSKPEQVIALREIKKIHLIENELNLGFTGGNNVGIQYAIEEGFELVMLLNNDTEVDPGFLEPLVQSVQSNEVAAVQPKIYRIGSSFIWSLGGRFNKLLGKPITIGAGKNDIPGHEFSKSYCVDWITGCCLVARSSVFKDVGLLSNSYFALCEDVDWSLRAKNKGYVLKVVPNSIIYHHESASDKSKIKTKEGYRSPFRQYLNVRNHLYLVRKFVPWYFMLTAFAYFFIRYSVFIAYYIVTGRSQKRNMTIKGVFHGLFAKIR